ncbi:hypothetical protein [Mesorhizobium sp. M7A.F.Ca.MR.148.00.0.0]|uniref:hypothetical protein n=1 Tax=Mesorhizobium sp. M7A.F.Ca.MR.148.00.0.0 TaxID=2496775 RepID=UPI000FCB62FB|nr:hypothetical protein [Mesorhizobium sp. M7A.F.Ca.MR.148.00.0.0]RUV37462.1 hypothetical protein EOB49_11935 [Mesorhizobium sp. M7A.F.Ca.MR.148.00.0.0]
MFFVDVWSVGHDEIPRKQFTPERIQREGRFSSFEASANPVIAKAITALLDKKNGLLETYLPESHKGKLEPEGTRGPAFSGYPWTYVRLTERFINATSRGSTCVWDMSNCAIHHCPAMLV